MKFAAFALLLFASSFFMPRKVETVCRKIGVLLHRLGKRRRLCIMGAAALSLFFSIGAATWRQTPAPRVHDEFCYLLLGDTFAHGRLTNPPHPMWRHFESFHTIYEPTYTAKFPPGSGVLMALGQLLWEPILGVWIGTSLAMGAVCWALYAWLPGRWVVPATLLAVFNPQVLAWNWTFWGGTLTLGAGALVLGAWRRFLDRRPPTRDAWQTSLLLGLGVVLLMVTRPFEGFSLIVVLALYSVWWLTRKGEWARVPRMIGPATLVLMAGVAGLLFYNFRVTGNPLLLPYMLHARHYMSAPLFIWGKMPPEPQYNLEIIRQFHLGFEGGYAREALTLRGFLAHLPQKFGSLLPLAWGGLLALLLPGLPRAWRLQAWVRRAVCLLAGFLGALLLCLWLLPHYTAPGLLLAFVVFGWSLAGLSHARCSGRRVGVILSVALPLFFVAMAVANFFVREKKNETENWGFRRQAVERTLSEDGGKHLVLVSYSPGHRDLREWVYNGAEIDASPIVWARSLGSEADQKASAYWSDRKVWRFDPDQQSAPEPMPAGHL